MITINNSTELLTASINEAYKENGELWDKVLILRFPKAEFSLKQATQYATEAETVTNVTETKIVAYSVTDILKTEENEYCINVWLKNPEVTVTANLAEKLTEAEEMLDIITGESEGVANENQNEG